MTDLWYTGNSPITSEDPARDALVLKAHVAAVAVATKAGPGKPVKKPRQTWATYDRRLTKAMEAHGIIDPVNALAAAVYTSVNLSIVCTSLHMESWGGHNVWGADPAGYALPVQWYEAPVTPSEWSVYWTNVLRGLTPNGCGGMQLTDRALQESANALGGCWLSGPNFKVGALFMRQLLDATDGNIQLAFQHYNGAGPAAEAYGYNAASLENQLHLAFEACR